MPSPIRSDSIGIDLRTRFPFTTTVGASPALAAETIIGTLTIPSFADIATLSGIILQGWAAYTVGTSGTAATFKIRQTNVSGATIVSTGALTKTAASLYADDINGVDTSPVAVYVLTMQVTSGGAASTVSALYLGATIV